MDTGYSTVVHTSFHGVTMRHRCLALMDFVSPHLQSIMLLAS